jgi:PTH2 family peptidyl-tRNA hydrolase
MSAKQVIVVRKDLKMRKGKLAAQVAHASMKVILDLLNLNEDDQDNGIQFWESFFTPAIMEWMEGSFTKVVVSVDSEDELLDILRVAKQANIPSALITDTGLTEFHGIPTNTCVAVGPDEEEKVDLITGELKLL